MLSSRKTQRTRVAGKFARIGWNSYFIPGKGPDLSGASPIVRARTLPVTSLRVFTGPYGPHMQKIASRCNLRKMGGLANTRSGLKIRRAWAHTASCSLAAAMPGPKMYVRCKPSPSRIHLRVLIRCLRCIEVHHSEHERMELPVDEKRSTCAAIFLCRDCIAVSLNFLGSCDPGDCVATRDACRRRRA